jgi:hypothetical protein
MPRRWLLALLLPASVLLPTPPLATPASAQSGPTQVAAIETTAPLDDQSDGAVKHAIATAVQTAAKGALAMGLPWVRVQSAYVREGYVGVQVFAMAQPPEEMKSEGNEGSTEPELSPGEAPQGPTRGDLDAPARKDLDAPMKQRSGFDL